MSQPGSKLLTTLLVFIGGTVLGAAGKPLGAVGIVVGSAVGSFAGWVGSRWVMRRMF